VLEQGRVAQVGPIAEVAARPRSRYVADLVGINLLRGRADGTSIALETGGTVVAADAAHGDVYVAVHPNAVALHLQHPEGSPRNVWHGRIHGTDLLGDRVRIHVDGQAPLVAEVTPAAVAELGLFEGTEVFTSVKATELSVYPA
jgi:molybdate transport system ATP-binding protein